MNLFQKKHDWILGGFEFLQVDNVVANAGSGGATFATDDIAGVHYPRSKMVWGADGAVNDTSAAAPLPVVQTGTPALPTGAATAAKQPALGTAGTASADVITVQGVASMTAIQIADNGGSLTIDAASLPLPTGASTAAKQPALGTAGSASADVITIQGVASMTAVAVSDNGGSLTIDAASLPLPTGAATEATLSALNTKTATDKTSDYDTGAGTDTVPMVGLALPASGGAVQGGTSTNPIRIDPTGTTTQPVSLASVPSHAVTNAGTFAVQAGQAAHDAAISGNPVRVGGRAVSADVTAVATGDTADLITDLVGKQIVMPYSLPENMIYGATAAITGTAATEVFAAAGVGVRNFVTQITVTNSHATVGTVVELRDGITTVIHRGYAAPAGGGYTVSLPVPIRGTANTAVNAYNITTGSNTYVSASGFKGA